MGKPPKKISSYSVASFVRQKLHSNSITIGGSIKYDSEKWVWLKDRWRIRKSPANSCWKDINGTVFCIELSQMMKNGYICIVPNEKHHELIQPTLAARPNRFRRKGFNGKKRVLFTMNFSNVVKRLMLHATDLFEPLMINERLIWTINWSQNVQNGPKTSRVILLHDYTPTHHTIEVIKETLKVLKWDVLPHKMKVSMVVESIFYRKMDKVSLYGVYF